MRRPIIAGNWKMNKNVKETVGFLEELIPMVAGVDDADIVVAPPFTALSDAKRVLSGSNINVAAQNMHALEKGAYTGCISATMVKELCDYVILGHSERREFFCETNEMINRKVKSAVEHGITPILCIGEWKADRDSGRTHEVLHAQVSQCLQDVPVEEVRNIILAYEPVWAISRGDPNVKPATPDVAQEAHGFIRGILSDLYDDETSQAVRILYGGSMKPENVNELMKQPDIDGGLVGGASLKLGFADIVKFNR